MTPTIPRRVATVFLFASLGFTLSGCSSDIVMIKGQLVRNGEPLDTQGARLRIVFYLQREDTESPVDPHMANVKSSDATFFVPGRRGKGIPNGAYRISVQLLKGGSGPHGEDLLEGAFSPAKTPFNREFTRSQTITLDIENPED